MSLAQDVGCETQLGMAPDDDAGLATARQSWASSVLDTYASLQRAHSSECQAVAVGKVALVAYKSMESAPGSYGGGMVGAQWLHLDSTREGDA